MGLSVVIVDDEPNVLDGLRRSLRGFRKEWDLRFAQGGPAALAAMDRAPADVVVSDMRMPGMDGDALLAEVRRRYPRAVRIVLTGECTRDAMVRVTALAHRVLTKPCDPDELRAAVGQAAKLQGLLHNSDLEAAIGRLNGIPSEPETFKQIRDVLADPHPSPTALGRACARDVGVTAKLLQVANSALFGSKTPTLDPGEAVHRIGADMTKALVLTEGVLTAFDPRSIAPYTLGDLWSHSRAVAGLATDIAKRESNGAEWVGHVPCAGVLHDIGRLILATTAPRGYIAVLRQVEGGATVTVAEREMFGATHAEVGAYLLGMWGIPMAVVEAVAWHHTPLPSSCPVNQFTPVAALHAAESLLGRGEGAGPDAEFLGRLGLVDRVPTWTEMAAAHVQGG